MRPDIRSIQHIEETTGAVKTAVVHLALPADHGAFAGHFPGRPILPGVVQLDWAVQLAAICFGYEYRPARRLRVKFNRIIPPGPADLSVSLRFDPARAEIAFSYRIGDVLASSGSAWLDP
jgi:3-hydroxymyristoyl/3-hydroxydecanoyl-(acyl carrier protein) dehydratase